MIINIFIFAISVFLLAAAIAVVALLVLFIKYLIDKHKVLSKEQASKYIGKIISKEYNLNSTKGGLIMEEMFYHYDNGCNTKESLNNVYPLVINKIIYFGKKVR